MGIDFNDLLRNCEANKDDIQNMVGNNLIAVPKTEPEQAAMNPADALAAKYKTETRGLGLFSGADGWDKDYTWLVENQIPSKSIGFISGPSGCGKTFFAVDLMMSVIRGTPFLGRYPVLEKSEYEKSACLYLTAEGRHGIAKRFVAYCKKHGVDPSILDEQLIQASELFTFADYSPAEFSKLVLEDMEKRGVKLRLIVFDTMRAYSGVGSENDSSDSEASIKWMREVRNLTGAVVLAVHHSGKNNPKEQIKPGADADSVLRGSSNFKAAAEFVIGCTPYGATIEGVRNNDARWIWAAKLKDAKKPSPTPHKISSVNLTMESGKIENIGVISCVSSDFLPVDSKDVNPVGKSSRKAFIWQAIRNRTENSKQTSWSIIRDDFKRYITGHDKDGSASRIRNFSRDVSELIAEGKIVKVGDDLKMAD